MINILSNEVKHFKDLYNGYIQQINWVRRNLLKYTRKLWPMYYYYYQKKLQQSCKKFIYNLFK